MAVTSRGIITPDQLDEFEIVADLNVMSESINEALEDGANAFRGTSAARTSFTSAAPEGTLWVDTNGEKIVWVKQGVSWNRIWPPTFASYTSTSLLTPASNWTVQSLLGDMRAGFLELNIYVGWNGPPITVGASGNFPDVSVGTLNSVLRSARTVFEANYSIPFTQSGVLSGWGRYNATSGTIDFTHGIPGTTFNTGVTLQFKLSHFVA